MDDFVMVWENEDGDAWVEVADVATEEEAGTAAARQSGCVYAATSRGRITVQECECSPTHGPDGEGHLDECFDHPGAACVVRTNVECWGFESFGDLQPDRAEWNRFAIADAEAAIADGRRVYLPKGWAIVDSHVVDGSGPIVRPEAPSIPMFGDTAGAS